MREFEKQSFSVNVSSMIFFHTDIQKNEKARKLFVTFTRTQPSLQIWVLFHKTCYQ